MAPCATADKRPPVCLPACTVYERGTTQQMAAFTFADNATRRTWDESSMALEPIPAPFRPNTPPEAVRAASHAQSSFMYARARFPPPMAHREYTFARRVWYKADDGGCYCISKACAHPAPPEAGCRTARVTDYAAGFVIRWVAAPGLGVRSGRRVCAGRLAYASPT